MTTTRSTKISGALKAATLPFRVPIQIVWPTAYGNSAVIKRKLARLSQLCRTMEGQSLA